MEGTAEGQASPLIGDPRKLIEDIARALVDASDKVTVEAFEEEGEIILELRVAPEDRGKVIGKQGRTARSMRTLLMAVSMKLKKRYMLEIIEED